MFEILRAKLRKIERRTKQIHLYFMPRCSNFANLLAKLRNIWILPHFLHGDGCESRTEINMEEFKDNMAGEHTRVFFIFFRSSCSFL